MARKGGDPDSATSQFYIMLEPRPDLDGNYTVFGRVIKGMDVAVRIQKGDQIRSASVRPLTKKDSELFWEILKIESDRKTGGPAQ